MNTDSPKATVDDDAPTASLSLGESVDQTLPGCPGENNDALRREIKEVYGVDVSDIESAKLSEILDRLAAREHSH